MINTDTIAVSDAEKIELLQKQVRELQRSIENMSNLLHAKGFGDGKSG